MENCHSCRNKIAEYNCNKCQRSYCEICDKYIHSFSPKNNHIRRKIIYNTVPIKKKETSRIKYISDENGYYIYIGNKYKKNCPLFNKNKNPLFVNEKENSMHLSNNSNCFGNITQKSNNIKMKKCLSTNKMYIPKITYNLEYNDKNDDISKQNQLLSLSPRSVVDSLNDTNESLKRTESFISEKAMNNLISFEGKLKLMKKISQLNCELSNARNDIDQKLEILHNHLHNYDEENKKKMAELNYKNINEIINIISSQKDTLVKHLKDIMNDQEETIQKLLKKKSQLEEEINENKYLIEKYTKEKNDYNKEKENNEVLYNEKKNMLEQRHESEMKKIRNDYDNELTRLSNNYKQSRNEYLDEIQKGNEKIEKFKIKGQLEVKLLSKEIEDLQDENNRKNNEQENMINTNKDLKKTLNNCNLKFDEIKMKYKRSKDERDLILKSYNDAKNEVIRRKKENSKLHDLKYGRF